MDLFLSNKKVVLKGQFTPKIPKRQFPLLAVLFISGLFWYKLPTSGEIGHVGVCLLSDIMEPDGTQQISLSRNHDTVTQHNPQTVL